MESFSSWSALERRRSWWLDEPQVRSQSKGSERYLARRRSNGDEREGSFVVEGFIGMIVANDGDGSSVANRWLQLIA